MPGFNACRCKKCDAKVRWFGELNNPPPCDRCHTVNDYTDTEKLIDAARREMLEKLGSKGV